MKETKVNEHLKQELKDPHFKSLWEWQQEKIKIAMPIVDYRTKNKLSQGELARKIGVSQQHISKIESGDFSNIETLKKILRHIGYRLQIQVVPISAKAQNRIKKVHA